jgi:hypothetical protein
MLAAVQTEGGPTPVFLRNEELGDGIANQGVTAQAPLDGPAQIR